MADNIRIKEAQTASILLIATQESGGVHTQKQIITALPTLPAGNNNIGDVDVASLPTLPAGTNNIGDVDVLSLPALPAGTNNIGDVDVLSLPSLPAGSNTIGAVTIIGTIPVSGAGGGTQFAEDAPHTSSDIGTLMLVVQKAADGSLVSADGDYAPFQVDASGFLKVVPRPSDDLVNFPLTLATTVASYSAGQCIGGKTLVANVVATSGRGCKLTQLTVHNTALTADKLSGYFLIFDSNPSGAGGTTSNAATWVYGTGDLAKQLAKLRLDDGVFDTVAGVEEATWSGLEIDLKPATTDIYIAYISDKAVTMDSVSNVTLRLSIRRMI